MEIKELIAEAKDNVAANHHYQLFRQETGGWTRFDKLYDESTSRDRIELMNEVAIEYANLKLKELFGDLDPNQVMSLMKKHSSFEMILENLLLKNSNEQIYTISKNALEYAKVHILYVKSEGHCIQTSTTTIERINEAVYNIDKIKV